MSNVQRQTKDFTEEERATLLKQFHNSGLEFQEFAREQNLNPHTLKNWIWLESKPGSKKQYSATERKKTVETYLSSGMSQDAFSKTWGISGATLGNWIRRYEEGGSDGLMNKSHKDNDKRRGSRIPRAVQEEILKLKKQEPSFGLKKIKHWLYRFRGVKVSAGSIRKTVTSEGLELAKKPRKRKRSSERVRRFERARPMQLWQSDITQFTAGQSFMRVYLTVFMDDHSRYVVGWRLASRQTADLVIDAFRDAELRFGKPEEVLTDQGRQYFAWRGKSELEKLLEKEGIKHVVSRAHHPQTLGKCERFWETVSNEFWTRAKPQDLEEAKVRLKYFIDHYNHQRPHQGLDGQTPADRFFGVAEEVRAAIEKTVEANSLAMALGDLPTPPAFLIGQVGDQRIAFHGKSGGFYLTHETLGERDGKSNGEESKSESGSETGSCEGTQKTEHNESQSFESVSGNPDEGVVGEGDAGGAAKSSGESSGDTGILDGTVEASRSAYEAADEADKVLANDPASDCGVNGGFTDSAQI